MTLVFLSGTSKSVKTASVISTLSTPTGLFKDFKNFVPIFEIKH